MIDNEVDETASPPGDGANLLRSTIENSSGRLKDAVTVSAESAADSARHIGEQMTFLAGAIAMASEELESAGVQLSRLGRRLSLFTAILAFVALLSAGVTAFYAWETKQLVEVTRQQVQHRP